MSLVAALPAAQHVVVRLVARVDDQNALPVRCTQLSAPSVEPRRRSRSCPRTTALSIVAPATTRFASHAIKRFAWLGQSQPSVRRFLLAALITTEKQGQGVFAALFLFSDGGKLTSLHSLPTTYYNTSVHHCFAMSLHEFFQVCLAVRTFAAPAEGSQA